MKTIPFIPFIVVFAFGSLNAQEKVTFEDHIKPIFRNNCGKCHNPDEAKGGLDLSTYHALMAGGSSGPSVEAGNPDASYLLALMTHEEEPYMPPKSPKRPDSELELIRKWIAGGLLETATSVARVSKKPKFEFKLSEAATGKPEGPPPMPKDLLLEPVLLTARANAVTAVTTSPWAPLVAIGGQKQVILYNSTTFEPAGILSFPEGIPHILKFSRNGKLLLAGGGTGAKSGRVVVWDVETGDRVIEVGEDFDPALGYVQRTGVRNFGGSIGWQYRPSKIDWFRAL
ncbi:MAG: c-type cytochrome domain-containing protein, partial [Verrucomicrobiota bacterium]